MLTSKHLRDYLSASDRPVPVRQIAAELAHLVTARQAECGCRRTLRRWKTVHWTDGIRVGQQATVRETVRRMIYRGELLVRSGDRGMNRVVELPPPNLPPAEIVELRQRAAALMNEAEAHCAEVERVIEAYEPGGVPLAVFVALHQRYRTLHAEGCELDEAGMGWPPTWARDSEGPIFNLNMIDDEFWGACQAVVWGETDDRLQQLERDLVELEGEVAEHSQPDVDPLGADLEGRVCDLNTELATIEFNAIVYSDAAPFRDDQPPRFAAIGQRLDELEDAVQNLLHEQEAVVAVE